MRILFGVVTTVCALAATFVSVAAQNALGQSGLLVTPAAEAMAKAEQPVVQALQKRADVKRYRLAATSGSALNTAGTLLNLFDDASYRAIFSSVRRGDVSRFEADEVWYGEVEGAAVSEVLLFVRTNSVTGRINTGSGLFMLQSVGPGIVAVVEIDKSKLTPEEDSGQTPGQTK